MLVEMEHGRERPLTGPSVRLRVHQILHVHPPAPHDGMFRQQVAFIDFLQLEHRKQMHVLFVEEDGVIVDSRVSQQLLEFGPDFVMAPFVLGGGARLQLHAECVIHLPVSLSGGGCEGSKLPASAPRCFTRPAVSRGSAARNPSTTMRARAYAPYSL